VSRGTVTRTGAARTLARASTYLPEPPDTYTVDGASIGFGNEMLAEPLTEADATDGACRPCRSSGGLR
jgi:hypothetical protein